METKPLIVERTYNANIEKVWKAITDKDQMKEWYFELEEFKPEAGFKFSFTGGDENVQYLHQCEVIVADPPNKLSYSWTYPEYSGYSVVTFELFNEGEKKTRLRLSHKGLDSFPKDNPNFAVSSFTKGWNSILGESLKNYVETDIIKKTISISASAEVVWNILLNPAGQWANAFGQGTLVKTTWEPNTEVIWTDLSGDVGAKGIVKEHQLNSYLQVDMYDDVNAEPGAEVGEYSEIYKLTKQSEGNHLLEIESGPLAKKYINDHAGMWEEAIMIIKQTAERRD